MTIHSNTNRSNKNKNKFKLDITFVSLFTSLYTIFILYFKICTFDIVYPGNSYLVIKFAKKKKISTMGGFIFPTSPPAHATGYGYKYNKAAAASVSAAVQRPQSRDNGTDYGALTPKKRMK